MKNKIVLWGTNDQDERVLIALELKPHANKVEIMTFPESIATEEFSRKMMDEWRENKPFDLPEGHVLIERELTVADSILPDHLKVERSDVIHRAQTEWHFSVLSAKLHETYKSELNDIKERVEQLTNFDSATWDHLKGFWDKVQEQVKERNLFRDQADSLRDTANELFTKLKEMRTRIDNDFKVKSKENLESFQKLVEDVETRAAKGLRIQPLFDELKELQQKFKSLEFTRDDRNKVWNRIDEAFKNIKAKRSGGAGAPQGGSGGGDNSGDRLGRRYEGLMGAIEKMQESVRRDRQELDFQTKKVASSEGQLEAQIRQAKIKMIEERLHSKEEKLKEMTDTQADLERKMQQQADRDAKRQLVEDAKRAAEQKIRESMAVAAHAREEDAEKLEKAAEAIQQRKEKKPQSLFEVAGTMLGDVLMDALDTAKAVAEVAGEKIEEAVSNMKEEAAELKEKAAEKVAELKEEAAELKEELKEKAADWKEEAAEKVAELKEEAAELKEELKEKAADWKEEAAEKVAELKEDAAELKEELKEKAADWKEEAAEKVAELKEDAAEMAEAVKESAAELKATVEEKIDAATASHDVAPAHEDPASTDAPESGIEAQDTPPSAPEVEAAPEEEK